MLTFASTGRTAERKRNARKILGQRVQRAPGPEQIGLAGLLEKPMTENQTPFAHLSLERAIALRWALRDIKAKRLKLSPVSEGDLTALNELGLIEIQDDVPVLTQAGRDALD